MFFLGGDAVDDYMWNKYRSFINNMRDRTVVYFYQADSKLREEEKRALRYLETRRDCNSVQAVSITHVAFKYYLNL